MIPSIAEHASDELDQEGFRTALVQWMENTHQDPQSLQDVVMVQEHQAHIGLALANTDEYKTWLSQAHSKGLRGLFRSLRQKDTPWQRPFQDLPLQERVQARQEQWGAIWIPVDEPCHIHGLRELREDAIEQARTMQPINPLSLQRVIKKLPHKASGPDGVSYDFLKQLPFEVPFEAIAQLANLLNQMEQEALLPTQLRMVNIVMIPKSLKVERPIALTSCLYRLWNRIRKQDIVRWQLSLDTAMPWDHARPKKDCLSIAVGRMLQSELCKHNDIHTVTCLADLSCFYDTVDLDKLIQPARELEYPLLHLKMAIDLYRGPRVIQAEGIATDPQHYRKGILQGCPQAPAIAKLVLYKPLLALQRQHPAALLQTWVDDVSFDVRGRDPIYVAQEALQSYRCLHEALTEAGLKLNTDKTGFITSSKETAVALKAILQPGDPELYDVFRDLGIDATAAKRRRVPQVRKRFTKGRGRAGIMHRLKLNTSVRYRLHRGAIHPVMTWGAQANGLAPQRRHQLRAMAARGLKLQKSGSVDIVFDMNKKHPDPGDVIILQHVHTIWKLYHSFDDSKKHLFNSSWNLALAPLIKAKYPWQVVTGPLQALQAYSLDLGFDLQDGHQWHRVGYGAIPDCTLSIELLWPELAMRLQQEFKWQRLIRLTKYNGCEHLEQPLDWTMSLKLQRTTSDRLACALRAFHQGTLHGFKGQCPLCAVEISTVHLIWECSYWQGRVKDIPDEWKGRISQNIEPEIWHRGLAQLPFRERHGGPSTFIGSGQWHNLQPCHIDHGHACCCLDIAATCADVRHQQYIFAIGIFEIATKECIASITGICPGEASRTRATFFALKQLAMHLLDSTHVGISNLQVWKAWTPHTALERFPDLYHGLEFEDFDQVRPLLFLSHLQQEEGMKTRKQLQKSIKRIAQERAKAEAPKDFLSYQKATDEDLADILTVAAERVDHILRDPDHFLRKPTQISQEVRTPLLQQKKELIAALLKEPGRGGHQWEMHRSGAICTRCKSRIHSKSMIQEIKTAMSSDCQNPTQQKITKTPRMEVIKQLIDSQDKPQTGVHFLRLDKAYLRCDLCKSYILARSNEQIFEEFVGQVCNSGPLPPSMWDRHGTHTMQRQGNSAERSRCGARNRIVGDKVQLNRRLKEACPSRSQDLRRMFS